MALGNYTSALFLGISSKPPHNQVITMFREIRNAKPEQRVEELAQAFVQLEQTGRVLPCVSALGKTIIHAFIGKDKGEGKDLNASLQVRIDELRGNA
jgi:hypothetical protein